MSAAADKAAALSTLASELGRSETAVLKQWYGSALLHFRTYPAAAELTTASRAPLAVAGTN